MIFAGIRGGIIGSAVASVYFGEWGGCVVVFIFPKTFRWWRLRRSAVARVRFTFHYIVLDVKSCWWRVRDRISNEITNSERFYHLPTRFDPAEVDLSLSQRRRYGTVNIIVCKSQFSWATNNCCLRIRHDQSCDVLRQQSCCTFFIFFWKHFSGMSPISTHKTPSRIARSDWPQTVLDWLKLSFEFRLRFELRSKNKSINITSLRRYYYGCSKICTYYVYRTKITSRTFETAVLPSKINPREIVEKRLEWICPRVPPKHRRL